jgi:hypothetical protein
VAKADDVPDEDLIRAEAVPVGATGRRPDDPLPGRGLHTLAQHNRKRSSACVRTLTRMRLLWQLIGTLLLVGFMLKYWWLIALLIAAVAAWKYGPGLPRRRVGAPLPGSGLHQLAQHS